MPTRRTCYSIAAGTLLRELIERSGTMRTTVMAFNLVPPEFMTTATGVLVASSRVLSRSSVSCWSRTLFVLTCGVRRSFPLFLSRSFRFCLLPSEFFCCFLRGFPSCFPSRTFLSIALRSLSCLFGLLLFPALCCFLSGLVPLGLLSCPLSLSGLFSFLSSESFFPRLLRLLGRKSCVF